MGERLTEAQRKVLTAWENTDEDFDVLSFDDIAKRSNVARASIRRLVRDMARRGYTHYVRSAWTDDGDMCGAGYGLTPAGRSLLTENPNG